MPKTLLAFDTETSGLYRHRGDRPFTYSTCDANGVTDVYFLDDPAGIDRLNDIVDGDYTLVGHNMRFDIGMIEAYLGRKLPRQRVHDTMASAHVTDNQRGRYGLDFVAWELVGYPKDQDNEAAPYLDDDYGYLNCPRWILDKYQRADVERTMIIHRVLYPRIIKNGWQEPYDMECDLIWPTLDMEDRGVMIDPKRCKDLIVHIEAEAEDALETYRALSGSRGTPLGSDVADVIEKQLDIKLTALTKTKKKSTSKDVMEKLRARFPDHPLIESILKYRAYQRGVSIIEGYIDAGGDEHIIHPSIHPFAARTSRESCKQPNLQNVSKEQVLRNPYPIPARRCFRPKPGYVNVHIDYAGIEARLLAHFSEDEALLEIFRHGDGDFHSAFAAETYGAQWGGADKATRKVLRGAAKNGDFALGYGASWVKYAKTVGLPIGELPAARRRIEARFPSYIKMSQKFISNVRGCGYVNTIFGRRLLVERSKPYVGTNYVVQGSAAGILKRAQIRVDNYLRDATGNEAGLILPIHDEIVIEWPRKRLGELRGCLRDIKTLMVDFPMVNVPLDIEVELSTRDWATVHVYEIEENA